MELHRRTTTKSSAAEEASDRFVFSLPGAGDDISVANLLAIVPDAKHGFLEKRNTSLLHSVMPCCFRHWKPRYFVVVGGYCYRFSDEHGSLKGIPIPLDACTIRQLKEGDLALEPGCEISACLELSMIRKQYILRASSVAECLEWVTALRTRKHQAIREALGHAPISAELRKLNAQAATKFKRRIEKDTQEGEEIRKRFQQEMAFNPLHPMGVPSNS